MSHLRCSADDDCLKGFPSFNSTPGSSIPTSYNSSRASKTDLTALWEVVAEQTRQESSASESVGESSKDAAAREGKVKEGDGSA